MNCVDHLENEGNEALFVAVPTVWILKDRGDRVYSVYDILFVNLRDIKGRTNYLLPMVVDGNLVHSRKELYTGIWSFVCF